MKIKRPTEVKLLTAWSLFLAAWNILRFFQALRFWEALGEYGSWGGPLYLAISGGAWGALGVFVGAALWRRQPWAWGAALGFFAAIEAWFWFDRLALQQPHVNNLFVLAVHLIYLLFLTAILFSRQVRNFYHEQ